MLPIQCKKCGHLQDAGSALAPNDTCELCGTPIYGPKAQNPKTMAFLAAATFVGGALLCMPKVFLLIPGVLMVFFAVLAVAKRKR